MLDGRSYTPPTDDERLDTACAHIDLFMDNVMRQNRNPAVFVELRKHIAWYTKGMPGATELRRRVNNCADSKELKRMIEDFKDRKGE